jgi:hypothetical protein
MTMNRVLLVLAVCGTTACSVETRSGSTDDVFAESQEAFTGNWNFSWGVTQPSSITLVSATSNTCFLSGMVANLQAVTTGNIISASVNRSPTNYTLSVNPDGNPLGAYARCVNSVAGRTSEAFWQTGDLPRVIAPVTANRRCFLTGIAVIRDQPSPRGFRFNADNVRVTVQGSNWVLSGSQSGHALARASCLDVNQDMGSWLWVAGSGTRKDPLATNTGGVTCYLTGIGGDFSSNDWSNGAFITEENGQFFMNTKAGKSGWATCVR